MTKMGRPKMPKKERKSAPVNLRLTAEERKLVDQAADRDGIAVSKWIRQAIADKLGRD